MVDITMQKTHLCEHSLLDWFHPETFAVSEIYDSVATDPLTAVLSLFEMAADPGQLGARLS